MFLRVLTIFQTPSMHLMARTQRVSQRSDLNVKKSWRRLIGLYDTVHLRIILPSNTHWVY